MSTDVVTADGTARVLGDGSRIPLLGLGVWQVANDRECVDAVRWALELGYRHIDTAQAYGNEESVGQGLRESGLPREEVFITPSSIPLGRTRSRRPSAAFDGSEWTTSICTSSTGPRAARRGLGPGWNERVSSGMRGRSGSPTSAPRICDRCSQPRRSSPLWIRCFSPYEYPQGSPRCLPRERDRARGLQPAGNRPPPRQRHRRADRRAPGTHSGQVLLRWCLERGIPVIPKSTHRERIAENGQLFDFRLSDDDIAELDALDRTSGTDRALERKWWRS